MKEIKAYIRSAPPVSEPKYSISTSGTPAPRRNSIGIFAEFSELLKIA